MCKYWKYVRYFMGIPARRFYDENTHQILKDYFTMKGSVWE